jgi:N-methylhydantoinase A/oxoprolinase/acetone carboxylase beta subunit
MPHWSSTIYFDAIRKTRGKRFGEGMAIHIGLDIGGTFTNLAAYDARTGRIGYSKALTTHARPLDGIMACVDKVGIDLGEAAVPPSKVGL